MKTSKALSLLSAALLTGALLLFAGCEKSMEKNTGKNNVSNIKYTKCLSHSKQFQKNHDQDSIFVTINNGTIFVNHINLEVNCGFDYVIVSSQINGDTLLITETGFPTNFANCYCNVNTSFKINKVPKGKYHLCFYNGIGYFIFEKNIEL